jgi:hypothetical protein
MGPQRPAIIQEILDVDLPRPRDFDSPAIWKNATESSESWA